MSFISNVNGMRKKDISDNEVCINQKFLAEPKNTNQKLSNADSPQMRLDAHQKLVYDRSHT